MPFLILIIMKDNVEKKAADTILGNPFQILLGDDLFVVNRPTVRTMIEVSRDIARLPKSDLDEKNVLSAIAAAIDCEPIGDIFADFMLTGKYGFLYRWRKKRLAKKILDKYTPSDLLEGLTVILQESQVADFFALTTSLSAISLLKKTKEVG